MTHGSTPPPQPQSVPTPTTTTDNDDRPTTNDDQHRPTTDDQRRPPTARTPERAPTTTGSAPVVQSGITVKTRQSVQFRVKSPVNPHGTAPFGQICTVSTVRSTLSIRGTWWSSRWVYPCGSPPAVRTSPAEHHAVPTPRGPCTGPCTTARHANSAHSTVHTA